MCSTFVLRLDFIRYILVKLTCNKISGISSVSYQNLVIIFTFQACGVIYRTRRDYVDALDSYLKDSDEPVYTFAFINKIFSQLEANSSSFRLTVISRFPDLVRLNR